MHARRPLPLTYFRFTNQQHRQAYRCTRHRTALRSVVGRPLRKREDVGLVGTGSQLRFRVGRGDIIFEKERNRPNLPGTPSCGGRVRIFLQEAVGDYIFSSELLQRVQQQRSVDENRGRFDMFVSGFAAAVEGGSLQE